MSEESIKSIRRKINDLVITAVAERAAKEGWTAKRTKRAVDAVLKGDKRVWKGIMRAQPRIGELLIDLEKLEYLKEINEVRRKMGLAPISMHEYFPRLMEA